MNELARAIGDHHAAVHSFLREAISFQSLSGHEGAFARFVADWGRRHGLGVDLWQAEKTYLSRFSTRFSTPPVKHLPLRDRPTVVLRLAGNKPDARSVIFNAHSDVVPAPQPEEWAFPPWDAVESNHRIYGRGACDTKGPLASALWAMLAIGQLHPDGLAGDVLLELVPGEEDCVGLGTLTSVARGYTADAAVILEPTECQPRNASRGGCRFELLCKGVAVHGTVKWLGKDAIAAMRNVLDALERIELRWQSVEVDPLFAGYPVTRPLTVDMVRGGDWQGMICDACSCGGYMELLPNDDQEQWIARLRADLLADLTSHGGGGIDLELRTSEQYDGHLTPSASDLCQVAASVSAAEQWAGWKGFNSGCEAGLRARLLGTPTLVWGPGSLAQAHARDEFVDFRDVARVARVFAEFAMRWAIERWAISR